MNLELLFWASKATGDPSFRNIAISHAEKTMKYQIRKDGSSYHLACYDPETGNFIKVGEYIALHYVIVKQMIRVS